MSHVTACMSVALQHSSHVTRHTSHVTRHNNYAAHEMQLTGDAQALAEALQQWGYVRIPARREVMPNKMKCVCVLVRHCVCLCACVYVCVHVRLSHHLTLAAAFQRGRPRRPQQSCARLQRGRNVPAEGRPLHAQEVGGVGCGIGEAVAEMAAVMALKQALLLFLLVPMMLLLLFPLLLLLLVLPQPPLPPPPLLLLPPPLLPLQLHTGTP